MTNNPLDDVLTLEEEFYNEGYEAGVVDSAYAGMIEGKVFGIEKGYEKAFELARLHGRALVWQARMRPESTTCEDAGPKDMTLAQMMYSMGKLQQGSRLQKHVESLLTVSDGINLAKDNSDDAVSEFDDKLAKARTKAKVIANITGEQVNVVSNADPGIEDATGLKART